MPFSVVHAVAQIGAAEESCKKPPRPLSTSDHSRAVPMSPINHIVLFCGRSHRPARW